jgi:hypothetical protein
LGVHLSFSLIDQVEESLLKLTRDVDQEYALRRIDNGRLRIGLADSGTFPRFRRNPNAYLYVDQFESVDEILSACILSSYVPGVTGPLLEMSLRSNEAASRASHHLRNMLKRGVVKSSGHPVQQLHREDSQFWDGGLVNTFPVIDADTCLVTPFSGNFANPSISPSTTSGGFRRKSFVTVDDHVQLQISMENAHAIRCITLSSEDHVLESWFEQGHNDALQFLTKNSRLSVYSVASSTSTDAVA